MLAVAYKKAPDNPRAVRILEPHNRFSSHAQTD